MWCFFLRCGEHEFYLEMFVQLIHQASEELISVLLLSYVQLPVPHLEDLQQIFTRQYYWIFP